jgi:predicted nucleotide-binding protein (sugar kinase/HSP70/actin superfamily)
LASAEQQEVCWHLAQISPRLDLTRKEERQLTKLIKGLLSHKSKIVRVSAMDALTNFAERNETILKEVIEIINAQMKNGSPAILSRGRELLHRLEGKKANA